MVKLIKVDLWRPLVLALICFIGIAVDLKAQNDDTLFLPFDYDKTSMDEKEYEKLIERIRASDAFYARLKERADSTKLYRQIYPLLFKRPSSAEVAINNLPANAPFRRYKNDVIRSIRLIKLKPLGTSIYDTTVVEETGLVRALNSIHFQTLTPVIENYMQFKAGERLDPVKVSDNERIIRNAPIFDDARFIIVPVNRDTVDVILVVKDIFPLGVELKVNSVNNYSVRILNKNIFGLGHQLSQSFGYDRNQKPSYFFGDGAYIIRNINHSFSDITLFWSDNPINKQYGFDATKPFITPETRFAGGINVTFNKAWLYNNNEYAPYMHNSRTFDIWAGYATITERLKDISSRRQQVAITGRFYQIDYTPSPAFKLLNVEPMINMTRLLIGFNILRSEYYRTNMLYGYGKTEDIPLGHHAEVVMGWEFNEFRKRFYNGINLEMMFATDHSGLIGLNLRGGGYVNLGEFEDGVLAASIKVISPLIKAGKYRLRNFGTVGYLTGLNRSLGLISINDGNSTHLFNNYELLGYSRIRARIESVVFTPYYLLGFRFAPFGFVEAAIISHEGQKFRNQTIYPALGLGLRLRNENLVFSTFQFSLTYHPVAPNGVRAFSFEFSGLPESGLNRYLINEPEVIEFR